jgi:hypothetical protein
MDEKGRAERNEGCLNHLVRKNRTALSLVWEEFGRKSLKNLLLRTDLTEKTSNAVNAVTAYETILGSTLKE